MHRRHALPRVATGGVAPPARPWIATLTTAMPPVQTYTVQKLRTMSKAEGDAHKAYVLANPPLYSDRYHSDPPSPPSTCRNNSLAGPLWPELPSGATPPTTTHTHNTHAHPLDVLAPHSKGNGFFKSKDYPQAIEWYSKAIEAWDQVTLNLPRDQKRHGAPPPAAASACTRHIFRPSHLPPPAQIYSRPTTPSPLLATYPLNPPAHHHRTHPTTRTTPTSPTALRRTPA